MNTCEQLPEVGLADPPRPDYLKVPAISEKSRMDVHRGTVPPADSCPVEMYFSSFLNITSSFPDLAFKFGRNRQQNGAKGFLPHSSFLDTYRTVYPAVGTLERTH